MRSSLCFLIAAILLLLTQAVQADMPALHYPVPGGIALVKLDAAARIETVQFGNNRVLTQKINGEWYAVVGIPLSTKPARQHISYRIGETEHTAAFNVLPKEYETQHITIKDKRKVEPNREDLIRINKESGIIRSSLATWTDMPEVPLVFAMPVQGEFSSPFGLRRYFNGQPRNPHSGLDIAAAEGTPVLSPAHGIIITTGDYFFNGNTIFVDHGQGLISMFCHLSRIHVKPGQRVDQGQHIGDVGMTGRATGPHLHWSISLNNARIEPKLLLGAPYRSELVLPTQPD